jgi:hypothetical protein
MVSYAKNINAIMGPYMITVNCYELILSRRKFPLLFLELN